MTTSPFLGRRCPGEGVWGRGSSVYFKCMDYEIIRERLDHALDLLYERDQFLVDNELCERCLNHRLAMYLQNLFPDYFVDCEYNRSHVGPTSDQKRVTSQRGNYIDIIIGQRDGNPENDLFCIETKRAINPRRYDDSDRRKLVVLTAGIEFSYDYGFYIVYGETRGSVVLEVFQEGMLRA